MVVENLLGGGVGGIAETGLASLKLEGKVSWCEERDWRSGPC